MKISIEKFVFRGMVVGIALALFACVTKTYYVNSEDAGYTENKVSDTVYSITVKSRNPQERPRLQDIYYLRAAEIAKENGYPFFYSVDKIDYLDTMNPKAKPFKERTITIFAYQTLTITGMIKLIHEKPSDLPYPVLSSDAAYRQRQYLITEREKMFGKKTEAEPSPSNSISTSPTNDSTNN